MVYQGINVQPGQEVFILADIDQGPLVRLCTSFCYEKGASYVSVFWNDPVTEKIKLLHTDVKRAGHVTPFEEARWKWRTENLPCMLYIESGDPDAYAGLDPEKLQAVSRSRMEVIKKYRDDMDNKYQWCIAGAASYEWAQKVFPDLDREEAYEALWEKILTCSRVTEGQDALAAWDRHNRNFIDRSRWLNDQAFDHLIYHSSNGTDFTVGLQSRVKWEGGQEVSLQNIIFNPNIPTEEVFTTPVKGRAEGTLVATKPLSYQGQLIRDFSITFKEGRAVEVHAQEGEDLLRKMIATDETASYLGEVALVPKESPIQKSGVLFYNTLFDENASCHVALGHGFTNLLSGYETMTLEETVEAGINDSCIHVDFMIGAEDMTITGVKADGTRVKVFEKGTWAD